MVVEEAVAANEQDPRAALSAALSIFLSAAATHPLVRTIAASQDGDELLALVTVRGGPGARRRDRRPGAGDDRALARRARGRAPICWPTSWCGWRSATRRCPAGTPQETADGIVEIAGPYIDQLLAERAPG